jgi:hypothetical protein
MRSVVLCLDAQGLPDGEPMLIFALTVDPPMMTLPSQGPLLRGDEVFMFLRFCEIDQSLFTCNSQYVRAGILSRIEST